jgi:hypothetical protein
MEGRDIKRCDCFPPFRAAAQKWCLEPRPKRWVLAKTGGRERGTGVVYSAAWWGDAVSVNIWWWYLFLFSFFFLTHTLRMSTQCCCVMLFCSRLEPWRSCGLFGEAIGGRSCVW